MRQMYTIIKDLDNEQLVIREFAELDKESHTLLCEESFEYSSIKTAITSGNEAVVQAIRTPNLYPPTHYVRIIAESIISFIDSDEMERSVLFDDVAAIIKEREEAELELADLEDEAEKIHDADESTDDAGDVIDDPDVKTDKIKSSKKKDKA